MVIMIMMIMKLTAEQVSVLERMDEGLKVLECLLPAYFKVDNVIICYNVIIMILAGHSQQSRSKK